MDNSATQIKWDGSSNHQLILDDIDNIKPEQVKDSSPADMQDFIDDNVLLFSQDGDYEIHRIEPNPNVCIFVIHRV